MTSQHSTPSSKNSPNSKALLRFGEYHIDRANFELRKGEQGIAMEPQVFSLLLYLIEHRERVVAKDELLDELWGHRFVSESALTTQIKWLRKAVGDDGRSQSVVKTVHGRGYRFIAELVETQDERGASGSSASTAAGGHNLPRERTRLFGRAPDIERVVDSIHEHRLVSLLGVGGTGKTRLALAAARRLVDQFPNGVCLVDLIPASDASSVEYAVSDAIGLVLDEGAVLPQLTAMLGDRELLLVFDNCEHVCEPASDLADQLLEQCASLKILATSREPLDLADEYQLFIDPLATESAAGDAPAVQLFRAAAERVGGRLTADDSRSITSVCTMLDGLPLALELAAAQLKYLSLPELIQRLDRPLQILARPGRSRSQRQSSLSGVLADSWGMLDSAERSMLSQLAVFPGQFSIVDVEDLYSAEDSPSIDAAFSRLVELSLLSRAANSGATWRLLETVRRFVEESTQADDRAEHIRRHANWCIRQLGSYPADHLDNLEQASWCMRHAADLVTAEENLVQTGNLNDAMFVCASTGLMVQLDDGAGARARRRRAQAYLARVPDTYWQARLHAICGLCAQANRSTAELIEHSRQFTEAAELSGDSLLVAEARLMTSLTEVFVDPERALRALDEVEALGLAEESPSTVASSRCYRAWQLAIHRDYESAAEIALGIAGTAYSRSDNTAYNAICVIISCSVVQSPDTARQWLPRLNDFPGVQDFWGIQALQACVAAVSGTPAAAARGVQAVTARLRQAGRDELPDVLVPAALLAHSLDDPVSAERWLRILRELKRPIQTYHMMIVYRQLYERCGFASDNPLDEMSIEDVRKEVADWLDRVATSAPS